MSDVTLDQMGQYQEPVNIFDARGTFLGVFLPAKAQKWFEVYARVISQIDWAEIERRKQAKEPGETWDVTKARFARLETEINRRKASGESEFTTEEALAFFRALPKTGE